MSITKSFLRTLPRNSADYVIAHAKFQKKRGRGVSATFRGIRNPKKALIAARAAMVGEQLSQVDPFAVAEGIAGVRYRDSKITTALGMGLHMALVKDKRAVLQASDDTHFGSKLNEYIRILQSEGFEQILDIPFCGRNNKGEHFFVFYHADGILLCFDTYEGNTINSGNFYYNWIPKDNLEYKDYHHVLSSSGVHEYDGQLVRIGSHDCRESLRQKLSGLRKYGTFVNVWVRQPFLWLLHYMDTKGPYDYEAINGERISMMPQNVQNAIAGVEH